MAEGVIFDPLAWPLNALARVVYLVVMACWLAFAGIAVLGKRGAAVGAQRLDRKSLVGMLLQGAAYAICFGAGRARFSPLLPISKSGQAVLGALAIALALVSTWFCYAAARALGKQWALVARVIEGHELIRRGPYAIVRNPIYLAMFGMLIASALAFSRWQALLPATAVYLIGTAVRIHSEETLLKAMFGTQFEEYSRRVPAFLPRL